MVERSVGAGDHAAARRAALECANAIADQRKATRLQPGEYHACKTLSFGSAYGLDGRDARYLAY